MSNSIDAGPAATVVENYRFRKDDLKPGSRLPGIGAFMRVKNGADFIERTIRSHIGEFDEIVAVHNQCSDATPAILARLAAEFGPKLRIFHYLPKVHPPGSDGHKAEPADSPASFVNQSNFALVQTRHRVAIKLDDDHLAMPERLALLVERIRAADYRLSEVLCFSGINVARDENGRCGALEADPFVGTGDHFFFEVTPETHFIHDPRFEDFAYGGKRRMFTDFAYWHLKLLKPDFGFGNRDIGDAGNERFARKRAAFLADRQVISLDTLRTRAPAWTALPSAFMPEKARLIADRWRRFLQDGPTDTEMAAICEATA